MAYSVPTRRYLILGLALSVAVHVGVGVVAGVTPASPERAVATAPIEMFLLPAPAEPRLGLEVSDAQTEAWLGFEQATAHEAIQSEVEQSALTPSPLGGEPVPVLAQSPPSTPEPATSESTPSDAATSNPSPVEPAHSADPPQPDPLLELVSEPPTEVPIEPIDLLAAPQATIESEPPPPPQASPESEPPQAPSDVRPVPTEPPTEPIAEPARSTPEDAAPPSPPTPPVPDPIPPGAGGELPGEQSPSESAAASLDKPIEIRPGRVAAAQGLQITTVRPVFSIATLALAHPRSPTMVIEFGKDGRVRRANFVQGKATGETGVDQPLLDAVYRWTAAGDRLEHLSDDPEDVVAITMRIILR